MSASAPMVECPRIRQGSEAPGGTCAAAGQCRSPRPGPGPVAVTSRARGSRAESHAISSADGGARSRHHAGPGAISPITPAAEVASRRKPSGSRRKVSPTPGGRAGSAECSIASNAGASGQGGSLPARPGGPTATRRSMPLPARRLLPFARRVIHSCLPPRLAAAGRSLAGHRFGAGFQSPAPAGLLFGLERRRQRPTNPLGTAQPFRTRVRVHARGQPCRELDMERCSFVRHAFSSPLLGRAGDCTTSASCFRSS